MPRLNELQSAYVGGLPSQASAFELPVEETLVPDRRLRQSTSQILEDKLRRLTHSRRSMMHDETRRMFQARP